MADVLAYLDDFFFQSKLVETAKQAGVILQTVSTLEALGAELARASFRMVIVDLNAKSDPITAISHAKTQSPAVPLIAFVSHVQVELMERARAAGCDDVMPRSKFTRELATILGRAKSHQ